MYHKWLRSFHAVAREGGFTAAARALRIGQSTVSEQVKALEQRFGVELFHRKGRNVVLTDTGRSLLAITHDVFGHEDEAIRFLSTARDFRQGQLRIGAVGPPVVIELVKAFKARYPDIQLSVAVGLGEWALRGLADFRTDVAILPHLEGDPRFSCVPYKRSRVVVFVNADHPWAGRDSMRIEELEGQNMVLREESSTTRQALENAAKEAGVTLGSVMEINSRETVREAIIQGLGIGVVAEMEYTPDARLRSILVENADMHIAAYVTCLASRRNRPLIGAFMDLAGEMADRFDDDAD